MAKTEMKQKEIDQINNIKELEQFYVSGEVSNMVSIIEQKKQEIVGKIVDYANKHTIVTKWDNEGNPIDEKVAYNPIVVNNYFFKPITTLTSQEPIYNGEKLGIVFDYYCYLVAEVNDKIGDFPSSLTSFCKLAGISLNTLRTYRNSPDLNLRVVAEKIYDQISDENITMTQVGMIRERSTIFKMKSQNEMVEKQQPNINININEAPDLDKIKARIDKYNSFSAKKEKITHGK